MVISVSLPPTDEALWGPITCWAYLERNTHHLKEEPSNSVKKKSALLFCTCYKNLKVQKDIRGLSGKSLAIVNITRMVWRHQCNLAGKESGLECTCINNDDFTVLVTGGGRHL